MEQTEQGKLARQSLQYYLQHQEIMPVPAVSEQLEQSAGAFVSLKKHGKLRGCIGTFLPTKQTVAEEIIHNAVSAGTEDPRFWPVTLDEMPEIQISVDVLMIPEPIDSLDQLDSQKYGILIKSGSKTGLLLPDLEGVDTVQQQIDIARQKAGINIHEKIKIFRFKVSRYK